MAHKFRRRRSVHEIELETPTGIVFACLVRAIPIDNPQDESKILHCTIGIQKPYQAAVFCGQLFMEIEIKCRWNYCFS
jgi:hypothetical protein